MTLRNPLDRATPLRSYEFPEIYIRNTTAGRVLAADLPGQPLAWLCLLVANGALWEPVGAAGVSMATAGVLSAGTARHEAIEWGSALESLGARHTAQSRWTAVTATVDLPVGGAAAAAELLAESVRTPALREDDIQRTLADHHANRQEAWAQPGQHADAALRTALFDSASRFGHPLEGTPATVATLDPSTVRACHSRWLASQSAVLVAGDLTSGIQLIGRFSALSASAGL